MRIFPPPNAAVKGGGGCGSNFIGNSSHECGGDVVKEWVDVGEV